MAKRHRQNNIRPNRIPAVNEAEWQFLDQRVRARTGKVCSCSMCGNPRRKYGNGAAARTFAELRPWD